MAAFMVCIFHFIGYSDFRGSLFSANSTISNIGEFGTNGVYIFFVISGFVIPLSLSNENFRFNKFPRYLLRRFTRIEIPYMVSIFMILFVGFIFSIKNNWSYSVDIDRFLYHIIYIIPYSKFEWYNIIYWTLAIEFQFYIVIGLLYFFLSSANKKIALIALTVFGLLNFIVHDNRFIFHYSIIFVQGIILFLINTQKVSKKIGFFFIALFAIATAYLHSLEISFFCLLTILSILYIEINNKFTKLFGDVSYSLYLTHGLIGGNVLYLFARYTVGYWEKILLVIIALGVSLLCSYLYWWLIENPSRKLSKKISVS